MACVFSEVFNGCGCPIGYNIPLETVDDISITSYPVTVLNVNAVPLGEADSPSEYAQIWNSDPDDQAVGTLFVGGGAYCFYLKRKIGVTPPVHVLGEWDYLFLATDNNDPIEHDENNNLIGI